jgi:hypothetical protein
MAIFSHKTARAGIFAGLLAIPAPENALYPNHYKIVKTGVL